MSTESSASLESAAASYTSDNIKTLKDAAHIRQNPGMYVGNTDTEGLHHLVYEVVYNSVDEALAGYCKSISVTMHVDGSISVCDDGRGIPVDIKSETGKSTLEEALTIAGTSGKFDNAAYRVSAGLHGMGAKAMNALSEWCEAEVRRGGRVYKMEFERGYASGALLELGPAPDGATGTDISFKPDAEIFGALTFDYEKLATRFRQIAYLNSGLKIIVSDERDGKSETFHSERGIAEYVEFLNTGETPEHVPVSIKKEANGITVEVCIQYTNCDDKKELCFTNNAYNKDGGTHLSGFRSGLTRSVTNYGKKDNFFRDMELKGEDFRDGLTAVISVSHPDPSFESQTKVKLTSPEVDGIVSSIVYESLSEYLEKNPKEATKICKKIALAAEARIAAKKARDAIIDRKKILGGGGLPGKLMDCSTKNREESELFLVEGDSAGGSAESGRDRHYQAVLPLRGKVLNVEKARLEKLLKNEEIASLIAAVGVDIGNTEEIAKVRYGKIIILTDADVDGQHIRTLLLTFFFRQMRKLVETGSIFVARPPLFKVTQKKEVRFVQTREEMAKQLMERGLKDTAIEIAGEPPRKVSGEALSKLLPVLDEIEAAAVILERRGQIFADFLKKEKDGVLPMFHVRGGKLNFVRDLNEVEESLRPTADEWHEVRSLNKALVKLKELGFGPGDLLPLPRVAGREPVVRFTLIHGDSRQPLADLRELVADIRKLGEKGWTITRFKGLGEMDPEELWDTTLDPTKRTLAKVTLSDAIQAEKMFRMLMGDDVEGRREYILKNRISSLDDIDYGA
ncbi:MAG: DNA gyrase subunit B [Gemmataceae bacterium]